MNTKKNYKIILLIIAFLEGAAVMAAELLGAKMIAPFFGTTIYSWAGVLAVTLSALAAGYYIGGMLTTKYNTNKLLIFILLASGVFLFTMPFLSKFIMVSTMKLPIITGLLVSLILFLFPPILFFGMTSPVIIHSLVSSIDITGKTAGKIYAISTIGGVANTLLLGFYVIPEYGIKIPTMICGAIIILLPIITLLNKHKLPLSILLLIVFFTAFYSQREKKAQKKYGSLINISYASEGLLGQVKVMDFGITMKNFGNLEPRGLLVNNTWQTIINKKDQISLLDYIYFINPILSRYSNKGNALLIGLGGGTLTREIQKRNIDIEVVEIDKRLKNISIEYFHLNPKSNIIIDDGRHYLYITKKKYDLIIFDAFLGENPPWHLLTLESFKRVKELLNPDGVFLIEFYGYMEGNIGRIGRSVFKTLNEANFNVEIVATRHEAVIERNFIFVSSVEGFDFENLNYDQFIYSDQKITDLRNHLYNTKTIDIEDADLLTDNRPILEKLMKQPTLEWRKSLNKIFRDKIVEENLPIFY